jgi:hypothetical protein
MNFNITTLMRLLNRLFSTPVIKRTVGTTLSDYGIFYSYAGRGTAAKATIEYRSSLRDGIAMITPGTGVTLASNFGQYQVTPEGYTQYTGFFCFSISWAAFGAGAVAAVTRPGLITWTKIGDTDDTMLFHTAEVQTIGSIQVQFEYAVSNVGVGVTISAVTGTLPVTGVTRLCFNMAGIEFAPKL